MPKVARADDAGGCVRGAVGVWSSTLEHTHHSVGNVQCVQADAERLPFADASFDCVTIAFGLRNVTHKDRALESMLRVLKPGGRLLVLEFSKPVAPGLAPVYDAYSFNVLPKLGQWVANDAASYQYLAESIRMHPDQETLLGMLGLENGDRLQAINGFEMASPEKALEAYARLRTADHLTVQVNRRGQNVNLDFNIK